MKTIYTWNNEPGPYHFNIKYSGQTVDFSGSDTADLFKKNCSSTETYNILKQFGWDQSGIISYSYNRHGFRCKNFDDRVCGIALGCSFTEGTSLPVEQSWPSLLTNLSGYHVWNLGSGGASIDTVFRILEYYLPRLQPRFVCLLRPPPTRYEYRDINGGYPIINPNDLGKHKEFSREWLTQESNGKYNMHKTILAIEQVCQKHVVPLIVECSQDVLKKSHSNFFSLGRDLMHPGTLYQQFVADKMWDRLRMYEYLFAN